MSQEEGDRVTPQQAAEAAGALQFIRRVMARTRERLGDYSAIGIWWGMVSVLAIAATFALGYSGHGTSGLISLVWAVHNVIGWSATLVILRRVGGTTPVARQVCWVWGATNLALWVVVWAALRTEAVALWALWTVIQLLVGLAFVSTGLIEREKVAIGTGLFFIASVPVVLAFPRIATLTSAVLMGSVYGLSGLVAWMQRRRARSAS